MPAKAVPRCTPLQTNHQTHTIWYANLCQGHRLGYLAFRQHGAEVIADGNIHIYGPLQEGEHWPEPEVTRWREFFCEQCEAELISIAGHWPLSERKYQSAEN